MKSKQQPRRLEFTDPDFGDVLAIQVSNRGEPYRDGAELVFDRRDGRTMSNVVFLDNRELEQLRDKINEILKG